jgi:hypothetical protein
MNDQIMKRAMFAMPLSPEASNSGIMSGFSMPEEMPEEDDYAEEDRSPRDPEILMNNIRGDMRSVDARYMELANMVGEQAAQETPPEVLAFIQAQLSLAQQPPAAGIGALPGAPTPDQLPGAPAPVPAPAPAPAAGPMGQGPSPMPLGGGEAGPFPHGAPDQAPPTPDGLPPVRAAGGAFITQAGRQLRDLVGMGVEGAVDGAKRLPGALDAAAGRATMIPQPTPSRIENMRGEGGRYTRDQFVVGGDLRYPTLTQGAAEGLRDFVRTNPVGAGAGATALSAPGIYELERYMSGQGPSQDPTKQGERTIEMSPDGVPYYSDPYWGALGAQGMPMEPLVDLENTNLAPDFVPPLEMDAEASAPVETGTAADMLKNMSPASTYTDYVTGRDKAEAPAAGEQDVASLIAKQAKKEVSKSKTARVKEAYGEYSELYNDILGSDDASRKTQALLLLAEAGFKFAGNARPTMAMALADSLSGVTKGMSALAAQKVDRESKMKQLALSTAVEQVGAEDKAAQAQELQTLKNLGLLYKENQSAFNARMLAVLNSELERLKGGKVVNGAAGLLILQTATGSFIKHAVDPNDPTVRSAVMSPLTLNEANPYVTNKGRAVAAMVTNNAARDEIVSSMNETGNIVNMLEGTMQKMGDSYGPGAYVRDAYNNLVVPVVPLTAPALKTAENQIAIDSSIGAVRTAVAKALDDGRLSVQEQEWVNQYLPREANSFWADPQTEMKKMNTLITMLKNSRQNALTLLGYTTDQLELQVPPMGTTEDPFILPSDQQGQQRMFGFLSSALGKAPDSTKVYLKMPNGTIKPFSASTLKGQK